MQRIIADVGSTSGSWAILNGESDAKYVKTGGYNPYSQDKSVLLRCLKAIKEYARPQCTVTYYGTGISSTEIAQRLCDYLVQELDAKDASALSDLLGAARACCSDSQGVIAILGTGSNCAWYDGEALHHKTPSLGYPIGDEGSGWRIGAAMLQGYYYGLMPNHVSHQFREYVPDNRTDLLAYLRDSPSPNRYLASFATFAAEHATDGWVKEIVSDLLREFVVKHIAMHYSGEELHFVGGIASAFSEVLEELLNDYQIRIGKILRDPLPELVKYHLEHE